MPATHTNVGSDVRTTLGATFVPTTYTNVGSDVRAYHPHERRIVIFCPTISSISGDLPAMRIA